MEFTQEQELAIQHKKGPALVLAVPGSGKTTVLLARVLALKEDGILPKNILSMTFSRKQSWIASTYRRNHPDQAQFTTIHAFCYRLYRLWAKKQKVHYELIEGNDGLNKYHLLRRLSRDLYGYPLQQESLENFFSLYSLMKNKMLTLDEALNLQPHWKIYQDLFVAYENEKRQQRYFDFDDMLDIAYVLLRDDRFQKKIHRLFPYIQLDEAQDASPLQFAIVERLAYPDNNLFYLADDDQSIYGFRGASTKHLLTIKERYPETIFYPLRYNHRSSKEIVSISALFIEKNQQRYKKKPITENPIQGPLILRSSKNLKHAINQILDELEAPMETALLYRNHISALPLIYALEEKGISFQHSGTAQLAGHWLIRDLLALLDLIYRPKRSSFLQHYYKLGAYISKEEAYLAAEGPDDNPFENLARIKPKTGNPYRYSHLLKQSNNMKTMPVQKALPLLLALGYDNYLEEQLHRQNLSRSTADFIIESLMFIAGEETFEYLQKKISHPPETDGSPELVLSTIHGAKGLEFDRVIMSDLVDGEFPSETSREIPELLEEERRLFYVGMTRARKKLILSTVKTRRGNPVSPSVFYKELRQIPGKKIPS